MLFTLIDKYTSRVILHSNFGTKTDATDSSDHYKTRFNSWIISKLMKFKKLSICLYLTLTMSSGRAGIWRCLAATHVTDDIGKLCTVA